MVKSTTSLPPLPQTTGNSYQYEQGYSTSAVEGVAVDEDVVVADFHSVVSEDAASQCRRVRACASYQKGLLQIKTNRLHK